MILGTKGEVCPFLGNFTPLRGYTHFQLLLIIKLIGLK